MTSLLTKKRASGILAHITSLPSSYGIGDIGPSSSARFIDFLAEAGQTYWQILPTGPTSLFFDSSPYMSSSAFAGSSLLISPDMLVKNRLLEPSELPTKSDLSAYFVNFPVVSDYKQKILKKAFSGFRKSPPDDYMCFIKEVHWLDDYALFMTIKDLQKLKPWYLWPRELAARLPAACETIRRKHAQHYDYYRFEQYIFHSQWSELKRYATEKKIQLIGDIPIYLGFDSADVWSKQELFELDSDTLKPLRVSGVPPDYFSETGQRWGNPLYRWNSNDPQVQEQLLDWWCDRFTAVFKLVDVARIDHFRGFESYWAIPETEETAVKGTWLKGPGATFFEKIRTRLGNLNIIAEDLGEITEDVIKLRDATGFPGMKVLQFAFDGAADNPFLPHNFATPNCIVYTGTHDNNTTLGWFLSEELNDETRETIRKMANRELHDSSPVHEDFIYLALSSIAGLAIIPLQDLLGFGGDCRMNTPGVANGNWMWRCAAGFLSSERATWLGEITRRFNRQHR